MDNLQLQSQFQQEGVGQEQDIRLPAASPLAHPGPVVPPGPQPLPELVPDVEPGEGGPRPGGLHHLHHPVSSHRLELGRLGAHLARVTRSHYQMSAHHYLALIPAAGLQGQVGEVNCRVIGEGF